MKQTVKKITEYIVLVLAWLLLLYTVAGYYLLPLAMHYYVTHQFAEQAKHKVSVDEIHFDPFRFDFYMSGFRIGDENNKPLVLFEALYVDYNPQTLRDQQIAIELIELRKPYVQLSVDAKGKAELFTLLDNLVPPTDNPQPASPTPSVWLKKVIVNDARFDIATSQFKQAFAKHITIKQLQLNDFHTTDNGHANDLQLSVDDGEQGSIDLTSKIRMEPLQLTGNTSIRNIQLQPLLTALDVLPEFTLQPLAMDFSTGFTVNGQTFADIKLHNTGVELRGFSLAPKRENAARISVPLVKVKNVDIAIKQGKYAVIKNGNVAINGMAIYKQGLDKPLVSLPRIAINHFKVNTRKQVVNIAGIDIKDGQQTVVMDKEGVINLQTLSTELMPVEPASQSVAASGTASASTSSVSAPLAKAPAKTPAKTPAKATLPWKVTIEQLAVKNNRVHFRSEQVAMPLDIELYPVNIALQQFTPLETGVSFPLQMQMSMVKGGSVNVDAEVNIDEMAVRGKAVLKDIPLHFAQPVVNEMALVDIKTGALDGDLDFSVNAKNLLDIDVDGAMNVHDVSIYKKGSKKKVVSWHKLTMQNLQFALPENRLSIEHLVMDKSYARFSLNADGTTNIQELLLVKNTPAPAADVSNAAANDEAAVIANANVEKTNADNSDVDNTNVDNTDVENAASKPQSAPETVVASDAPPLRFDIALITLKDAELGFSDLSLTPSFRVAMKQLNGTIKGISSNPASSAVVDLHGKVDRYAPVDIAGTFNVFSEKLQMDMGLSFKNIDLTTFTPYSGVYAGYAIDAGKMNLDLLYNMVNDKVEGKNHIVINQLKLGKKVKSDKATSLPLKLGIALLRDENGVIDLGFEVNGNIDDPQFSINQIFFKAIKDVIKKATKAPFKFFSKLFKSKQKDVQDLSFFAGNAEINPVIAEKLKFVATLLNKREALYLNIKGNASPEEDTPLLQEQYLINSLAEKNAIQPSVFLRDARPALNPAIYSMLATYYKSARAEPIEDLEERISEELYKSGQQPDSNLIKQRSYDEAWQTLVDATAVTPADLQILARQRAEAVKRHLEETYQIPSGRISVVDKEDEDKPSLVTHLSLDTKTK